MIEVYENLNKALKNKESLFHCKWVGNGVLEKRSAIRLGLFDEEIKCILNYCYIVLIKDSRINKILYCTTTKEVINADLYF